MFLYYTVDMGGVLVPRSMLGHPIGEDMDVTTTSTEDMVELGYFKEHPVEDVVRWLMEVAPKDETDVVYKEADGEYHLVWQYETANTTEFYHLIGRVNDVHWVKRRLEEEERKDLLWGWGD